MKNPSGIKEKRPTIPILLAAMVWVKIKHVIPRGKWSWPELDEQRGGQTTT